MPIWLRKFTHHEIADYKQKEADAYKAANKSNKGEVVNPPTFNLPNNSKVSYNKK